MSEAIPPPLDLPETFIRHNAADPAWLQGLPRVLERLATRWSLAVGPHFAELSYNYVAPALDDAGRPCVLKLSRHVEETRTEIAALRLWNGQGAARLLHADPDLGALVLERLEPGKMLVELAQRDDDAATLIAADLLRQLWLPAPPGHELRHLRSWFECFEQRREALRRGERSFPVPVFERADALLDQLIASTRSDVILHGDHHHYNILTSQRPDESQPRWRVIDPKGLAGDPAFDICQFLFNPHFDAGPQTPATIARRVDIFTAELGLDRDRTKQWCFAWSVLQACWSFEDGDDVGWHDDLDRADLLLSL
jgi:streptomycin 6-kinase